MLGTFEDCIAKCCLPCSVLIIKATSATGELQQYMVRCFLKKVIKMLLNENFVIHFKKSNY